MGKYLGYVVDRSPRVSGPFPPDAQFLHHQNKKVLKPEISWRPEIAHTAHSQRLTNKRSRRLITFKLWSVLAFVSVLIESNLGGGGRTDRS